MNSSHSRTKTMVAAAVGGGLIAGAVGLLMFYGFENARKQRALQHHLDRLDMLISELFQEVQAFRNSEPVRAKGSESKTGKDEQNAEEESVFEETSDSDSEYFDCNSDEERTLRSSEENEEKKLFRKVDELFKGNDKDRLKAFNLLKKEESKLSENPDFLWRYAKAHQIQATVSGFTNDKDAKKDYIVKGLKWASKALEMDSMNPDAHKWFAIMTGMMGDYLPPGEQIAGAFTFKSHVDTAMQMKPKDYSLHHLLGRFKFEVANMSWLQQKLARAIYGEIPSFTLSQAMVDLERSESLSPRPWIENRLMLGKCCIGQGHFKDAKLWLQKALDVTPVTLEDSKLHKEVKELLQKIGNRN